MHCGTGIRCPDLPTCPLPLTTEEPRSYAPERPFSRQLREDRTPYAPQDSCLRVLWIDDEVSPDDALVRLLADVGIRVDVACNAVEGCARALSGAYDAILLDLNLPDMFGLTVMRRLVKGGVSAPVVIVSGQYLQPDIELEAHRAGVAALLHKPLLGVEPLEAVLRQVATTEPTPAGTVFTEPPYGIVAASGAMEAIVNWVERIASSNVTVLLTGETGTGKELLARAIHHASGRREGPFVAVNCAALPETLFDSELFGHRRGAFTGAVEHAAGLVEAAHHGSLFLDEVGDMSPLMQARLLRTLEQRRVRRIGETYEREVDIRVIAATNRPLEDRGVHFRRDLYYRLSVTSCHIPPLRERPADIVALIRYWLPRLSQSHGIGRIAMSAHAVEALKGYSWPGNARELRNVLERMLSNAGGAILSEQDALDAMTPQRGSRREDMQLSVLYDRDRARAALEANHWNRSETARRLGISRTTLWRLLRRDEETDPKAGT